MIRPFALSLALALAACQPAPTPPRYLASPTEPTGDIGVCDRDLRARAYFDGPPECQDALESLADSDEDYFTDNCRVCPGVTGEARVICEIFTWDGDVAGICDGTP